MIINANNKNNKQNQVCTHEAKEAEPKQGEASFIFLINIIK